MHQTPLAQHEVENTRPAQKPPGLQTSTLNLYYNLLFSG